MKQGHEEQPKTESKEQTLIHTDGIFHNHHNHASMTDKDFASTLSGYQPRPEQNLCRRTISFCVVLYDYEGEVDVLNTTIQQ